MGKIGAEAIWKLASAIGTRYSSVQQNVSATVTRIDDDGKVWVTMPGSTTETPCDGITHKVTIGDTVSVSTGGNTAEVTGSTSSPSVPDQGLSRQIELAKAIAKASKAAGEIARRIADQARQVAYATGQHFWHRIENTEGAGAGAFVTDVTREEFLANVHAGIAGGFYDLGEPDQSYSDTVSHEGDGETVTFALEFPTTDASTVAVTIDGSTADPSTYEVGESSVTFDSAPASGSEIVISYDRARRPWRNILMNSFGILLRTGLFQLVSITSGAIAFFDGLGNNAANIIATFGREGARIGTTDGYHTVINAYNISEVSHGGMTLFRVGATVDADGYREVEDRWTGDGVDVAFNLSFDSRDISGGWETIYIDEHAHYDVYKVTPLTVEIDGVETDDYTINAASSGGYYDIYLMMNSAPIDGSTITATYRASKRDPGMEMGEKVLSSGRNAFAHGYGSIASGHGAHAEGGYAYTDGSITWAEDGGNASGLASHATNIGTMAGYKAQTAIGKYNENSEDNAFEIGNGKLVAEGGELVPQRSNAMEVDWYGNATFAGIVVGGQATYGYLAGKFTYGRLSGRTQ